MEHSFIVSTCLSPLHRATMTYSCRLCIICDALRDLVSFLKFENCEKHPWRSVTFTKSNVPPWVFFTFFKLYKLCQIAQNITYALSHCWTECIDLIQKIETCDCNMCVRCLVHHFVVSARIFDVTWRLHIFLIGCLI